MNKRIHFDRRETLSRLRNGLVKTTGVEIADLRFPSISSPAEEDGVLQIQAVNSRQNAATGYVEIPFQESVLRQIGEHFLRLASEASGSDIAAQAHGLGMVIDHQIKSQSMAHEDVCGLLDDMMHHFVTGEEATAICDEGLEAQIKVIANHGGKDQLFDKLVTEGVWDLNVIESIYELGCQRIKAA